MNTKEYDAYVALNNCCGCSVTENTIVGRPSWNRYFMNFASLAAKRSTCERRQVGAVAVKDRRILAVGYNGAPSGLSHCHEIGGCIRAKNNIPSGQKREMCRAIHAEQNLLIQAAIHGISIAGADIYCTCSPCSDCLKMMISLGVKKFYYSERYPDDIVDGLLADPGNHLQVVCLKQE